MPGLAKKLKGVKMPTKRTKPVWKGPEKDGITQSLLSRFLVCRERFRLLVVEGLKPADRFSHRMEYGNMWHCCEESYSKSKRDKTGKLSWETDLLQYCKELVQRYRDQQNEIDKWYNVCKTQFPIYLKYWAKHRHTTTRQHLLEEEKFRVPYQLPSGRIVTLRGKWDAVDLVNKNQIYLQENKAKGDPDQQQIRDQLAFDLQIMMYLVALRQEMVLEEGGVLAYPKGAQLVGVRYNVIRRPLSGGKGTIRQHKPTKSNPSGETKEEFYSRLAGIIMEDSFDAKGKPLDNSGYFMRWDCQVSAADITRFEQRFLIPILEQLWDWWEFMKECKYDPWSIDQNLSTQGGDGIHSYVCMECQRLGYAIHWQHPYGIYNVLAEGGRTDLDEYISNGSEVGLQHTDNLFPELS